MPSANPSPAHCQRDSVKTRFCTKPRCYFSPMRVSVVCMKLNCLIAVTCICTAFAQNPSNPDAPQKRVAPAAYKNAPLAIRAALSRRHCELPETQHWDNTPLNIVRGHFASPRETDWAAICILPDGTTRALIFWGTRGPAPCRAEIQQGWALTSKFKPGEAGSLYLLSQSPKQILVYRKFFGDSKSNPVTHDGVEIGGEEASVIYYCYGGKWLALQGAD